MKSAKLQKFALSLLAFLSLFASSVSTCACSHHQEKAQAESSSCHEHQPETKTGQFSGGSSETTRTSFAETGCFCLQTAPKVVVKSENIKVKKLVGAIPLVNSFEVVFVSLIVSVETEFSKPLYLSDSFYNLSPGRAPPRS